MGCMRASVINNIVDFINFFLIYSFPMYLTIGAIEQFFGYVYSKNLKIKIQKIFLVNKTAK